MMFFLVLSATRIFSKLIQPEQTRIINFSKYSLTPTEGLYLEIHDPYASERNIARKAASSRNVKITEKGNKD